jgi:hypothetical protein
MPLLRLPGLINWFANPKAKAIGTIVKDWADKTQYTLYVISDCHGDVDEIFALLGYYVACCGVDGIEGLSRNVGKDL